MVKLVKEILIVKSFEIRSMQSCFNVKCIIYKNTGLHWILKTLHVERALGERLKAKNALRSLMSYVSLVLGVLMRLVSCLDGYCSTPAILPCVTLCTLIKLIAKASLLEATLCYWIGLPVTLVWLLREPVVLLKSAISKLNTFVQVILTGNFGGISP